MPELPEVETIVRDLARSIVGKTIEAADVRLPKMAVAPAGLEFRREVAGERIGAIGRRGKYAVIELVSGRSPGDEPANDRPPRGRRARAARVSRDARGPALCRRRPDCASPTCGPSAACGWSRPGEPWDARLGCRAALLRLYTGSLYRYAGGADDADQGLAPRSAAHRRHRQHLRLRGAVGGPDPSEPARSGVDETSD